MKRELILEDLSEKRNEHTCYIGFRRRLKDGTNTKEAWIGVHRVDNPEHEEYGNYCIMAWFLQYNEYCRSFEGAIQNAKDYLAILKQEYISGKRNWWTSKLKAGEHIL